jgi:EAL domain-containing protein (putative c-di-GMP-specific phosphodiesterase class I)
MRKESSMDRVTVGSEPLTSIGLSQADTLAPGATRRRRISEVIAGKAISIVCQPIVDLVRRRVVAVEALSRFPVGPERPPEAWFSEASAVGLSEQMELTSLEAALAVFPDLPAGVSLSVNVGPRLLATGTLSKLLESVPTERVVLELTEHVAVGDYRLLSEKVGQLRGRGTRLAVDDTGAGISSLAHILALRPDFIKLDRSLVSGVDTDPARRALAVALAGFAAGIGSCVVAEGIETGGELATLRALGIVLGQGFYLGRPAPVGVLFPSTAGPGLASGGIGAPALRGGAMSHTGAPPDFPRPSIAGSGPVKMVRGARGACPWGPMRTRAKRARLADRGLVCAVAVR